MSIPGTVRAVGRFCRDPVPVRRLVLSYPADRPVPRLARFAGETITTIFNDYLESGIWVGQLLNGK
jgi:hypothetical protein